MQLPHGWDRTVRMPWLVLLAALLLTAVATGMAQRSVAMRQRAAVAEAVEQQMGFLRSRLDAYVVLLRATRAFVEGEGRRLDRAAFHGFYERLNVFADYPGIRGIGYAPRLEPQRIAEFEASARADGMPGFQVFPPGPRPWGVSILYLEPPDEPNLGAIGFDMASEPSRAEAMARARDSGACAMTGRVTLGLRAGQPRGEGFLVYAPMYRDQAAPVGVRERRRQLVGFVFAPFRAADFFPAVLPANPVVAPVRVHAGVPATADNLLHAFDDTGVPDPATWLWRQFEFGGQEWSLAFAPRAPASSPHAWMPLGTAAAGLVISLLLWRLTLAHARGGRRLALAVQATQAALQGERRQRHVAESLSRLAVTLGAETDPDRFLRGLTEEATALTGAAHGFYLDAGGAADDAQGAAPPRLRTVSGPGGGGVGGRGRGQWGGPAPVALTPLLRQVLQGATVRLDDWWRERPQDAAPVADLPAGLPPALATSPSWLAACVRTRTGRVLGAVFLADAAVGHFTLQHERLLEGLAAQAAVSLENLALLQAERRAREALERSNRELDQFAHVASHDLKAPLRGVSNLAQWMVEDLGEQASPQLLEYSRLMRSRIQRMEALIDGILAYSRAGRAAGHPEPVDVGELLQEVVDLLSPPPGRQLLIGPGMPVLHADRPTLQQVFMNLLGNALQHGALRVEVQVAEEGDVWHFLVGDDGPGIAPEFQERIWGMFQTVATRERSEGTGVGLSVVRKIVQSRGGQAWVESEPGQGARFHFTWPCKGTP